MDGPTVVVFVLLDATTQSGAATPRTSKTNLSEEDYSYDLDTSRAQDASFATGFRFTENAMNFIVETENGAEVVKRIMPK